MTACMLPRVAGTVYGNGPFYAARSAVRNEPGAIVWIPRPVLPPAMQWATDDEVAAKHLNLDVVVLTELFFVTGVESPWLDEGDAREALDRALILIHCNLLRCAQQVSDEFDAHPQDAGRRWRNCETLAARLLGVEA